MVTKDLGMVTAYAYAVAGGYTGTEAQFEQLMADLAIVVDDFDNFSVTVTTLPAGSSATASYSNGVLSLGIPKGDKGDTGNTGATGATPQLSIGTVETTAEPSVTITGTVDNPVLNFGLVKGDKGDTGEVSEAELTQAFEDFSANGTVANAEQLTTKIRANDQTPYLFRTSGGSVDIGDREYVNGIVGGTVAWNQIVPKINSTNWSTENGVTATFGDGEATFVSTANNYGIKTGARQGNTSIQGHKYLIMFDAKVASTVSGGTVTMIGTGNAAYSVVATGLTTNYVTYGKIASCSRSGDNPSFYIFPNSYALNVEISVRKPVSYNLTQMFGSTIADYIYGLEQANAGAGVAFFKSLFSKPYYAYDAGTLKSVSGLVSHDMVGFNAWDEEWESGYIIPTTGVAAADSSKIRMKNYMPVLPNTTYYKKSPQGFWNVYFDANKNYIGYGDANANATFTTPANCYYIRSGFESAYGTTYKNDICINLAWDNSRNGEYEPYELHSYSLDSDLELRGIPKLDANNNLYYDGDVYEPSGVVTRKYGIVDLGSLEWAYITNDGEPYFQTTSINDRKVAFDAVLCSKYVTSTLMGTSNLGDKQIVGSSTVKNVFVKDSAYTDATAFKTAMSGVYLVYELATPTTETAEPYTNPQIVNDFGTEEYVLSAGAFPMPVGHDTEYPINLRSKLEMAPNSPEGNGDYIVRQTNGVNEYVAFANNATIQNILARLEALEG